jgi:hypothetical protein
MRRTAAVLTFACVTLTLASPSQAANPPTPGGFKAFGQHVSGLAHHPEVDFGKEASGAARFHQGTSLPNLVVEPEQEALCP